MDYEQDYSKLTLTESHWYNYSKNICANAPSDKEPSVVIPQGEVVLDTEDFD